jgi:hypothetical protein
LFCFATLAIIPGTHNSGAYKLQHYKIASHQWYLKVASLFSVIFPPLRKLKKQKQNEIREINKNKKEKTDNIFGGNL